MPEFGTRHKNRPKTKDHESNSIKNGIVIFPDQIAFIHIQPGLTGPKGSRSMRAVISEDCSRDFMDQLEKHEVDCTHMRQCISDLKNNAA